MTTEPNIAELLNELDAILAIDKSGSLAVPLTYLSRVLHEKSAAHIRSLTERLEKAEKDAGRYRWLRDRHDTPGDYLCVTDCEDGVIIEESVGFEGLSLDAAIDIAIAQEGRQHE